MRLLARARGPARSLAMAASARVQYLPAPSRSHIAHDDRDARLPAAREGRSCSETSGGPANRRTAGDTVPDDRSGMPVSAVYRVVLAPPGKGSLITAERNR